MKDLLFLIFISSICNCVFAQNYSFKHYSIENGLAQSQVISIYQDSQRYLWLGTFGGVSRFNGADFINYTKMDGLNDEIVSSVYQDKDEILLRTQAGISSLKDGIIKNIFNVHDESWGRKDFIKDGSGNIWFISDSRLNSLSCGKVQSVSITSSKDEAVITLAVNSSGNLFASVYGKGIYCRSGNKWVNIFPFTGVYKKSLFTKMIFDNSISGRMYLLTGKCLYVVDNKNIFPYKNKLLDSQKNVLYSVTEDWQGHIWLGTSKGAYYLSNKKPIWFNGSNGFTNNPVGEIYEDPQGDIWLTTNGDGFYKFEGFDSECINKINNSPFQEVVAIGTDAANNIWAGTDGNGLIKCDTAELTNIYLPSSDPYSKYIIAMGYKEGQPLIVSTMGGLWELNHGKFSFLQRKHKLPSLIISIIYDHNNKIWLANQSGCFRLRKDGNTDSIKNIKDQIQTITEVGSDSLLLGTNHGIVLVKTGLIDTKFNFSGISSFTVTSLLRFRNLIIGGTSSAGLFSIDLSKKTLVIYTTRNGLRSNAIYSLATDKYGTIWAGTGKGIDKFKIESRTQNIKLINSTFPDPVIEFNQNAILYYKDKIFAGSTKGLYLFNTNTFPNSDNQRPVVNIESVSISDREDPKKRDTNIISNNKFSKIVKVRYGSKHILIGFQGICYADPENIRYQYRLNGLDKEFSRLSKNNKVDFTLIPPGNYVFEVRAVTNNGLTSSIESLPIVIIPTLYQTWYFYAILLILVFSVAITIQWLLNGMKKKQELLMDSIKHQEQVRIRRQTAEDFHDDIGNKLTAIILLTDILDRKAFSEKQEYKSLINQVREHAANLYAGAKDILWALDPQSDNLHEVILKIKNLAVDLFANVDIDLLFEDFDIISNKRLPLEFSRNLSMIFKELFNNILKHANATQVIFSSSVAGNEVKIILGDNGIGFTESTQKPGRGLSNIKIRAERIKGAIAIDSKPGVGTTTTLKFNLED
jgi:signal transduction histidine kinase/ligand-binding sensor domain-containing protein